jgi:hypothetical protein
MNELYNIDYKFDLIVRHARSVDTARRPPGSQGIHSLMPRSLAISAVALPAFWTGPGAVNPRSVCPVLPLEAVKCGTGRLLFYDITSGGSALVTVRWT